MKSGFIHKHEKFFSVIIYILASLFLFYEMALQVSPSIMTSELMLEFNLNSNSLGVMAAFYFYSYTLMQIPSGLLYDRFGPRKLIALAIIICAAGSIFFGTTHSIQMLSLGRFLMGIGSSAAFIGVLIIAARWFHPKHFAFLVGIAQMLAALGAMGGSFPLAKMVNIAGWRYTIEILGFSGFVLALLVIWIVRDYPKDHPHTQPDHYPLGLWKSLMELFSEKQIWPIAFYAFLVWAPITIIAALWGVPYLMTRYNLLKFHASLSISMIWLGLIIASPLLGWVSDKLKRRKSLLVCSSIIGVITTSFLIFSTHIHFGLTYIIFLLLGIASSGQILSFALIKENVRPLITATAVGFNNMAVVLGGALFQPLVGWMISKFWDGKIENSLPIYTTQNYNKAFVVVPLCFFLSLIISLFFIKETYCKSKYNFLNKEKI